MHKTWITSACFLIVCASPALAQMPFKSYYPLEVGNRWTYNAIDLKVAQPKADPSRKVVIEVERAEPFTRKEVKDVKDGNVTEKTFPGFILKSTSGDKMSRDHVAVTDNGVLRVHAAGTPINPPLLFLKFDLQKVGDSWEGNSVIGNTTFKGTFTAKSETVSVPHGKFAALGISFSNNKPGDERVEIDYWFAKDVGMVKQRVMMKNNEVVLELVQFIDKKK